MATIEQQVADAILQEEREIKVGGEVYQVAPPTAGTLIMTSKLISQLPDAELSEEDIIGETLNFAKHCAVLGDIAATLILGAKFIRRERRNSLRTKIKRLICRLRGYKYYTLSERLAQVIVDDYTPTQLNELIATLLQKMEIGDFFGIITFLTKINTLRPTRVIE